MHKDRGRRFFFHSFAASISHSLPSLFLKTTRPPTPPYGLPP